MNDRPLVLVIGATGAQGGSVARQLVATDRWRVRALSRDPAADTVRPLRSAGVEVVRGDLGDPDSLRAASAGISALFLVTNYWVLGGEREYRYGRNAVDAAVAAGVTHIVYSSLPEAHRRTGGMLSLPHHDSKARLEAELRAEQLPATFVHPATYYENWPVRRLQRAPDGGLTFSFPHGDTPLAAVAIEDMGGVVSSVLAGGDRFHGKTVGLVGDIRTPDEYAKVLSRVLAVPVTYRDIPREDFARLPLRAARELADMFEFSRLYQADRYDDLQRTRMLYPRIQSFEQWALANRAQFAPLLVP
jgi:uncharacterized protein YbjT (DUF2867 family)